MLFKTKKQREEEEYFARMYKRLEEKKQIERVITPGRVPKEEPKPTKKKSKIISPLLKLLKPKVRFSRPGIERVMKLEPPTKRPKRILSAREKALQKIIQKRQSLSNVNPKEVLRQFYKDRNEHLLRHHRGSRELSFKTREELEKILMIQNKAKTDDMRQQRIQRERNILGRSMNLMKAHYNLSRTRLDFTGVKGDNILMADNIFKENPEDNILRKRPGSRHILDTGDNTLKF